MMKRLREANITRNTEFLSRAEMTGLSISFRGNELAGEVGEACNIVKKIEQARLGLRPTYATVDDLAEELADVIICVDLLAMEFDIDLEKAVVNKFNNYSKRHNLATFM